MKGLSLAIAGCLAFVPLGSAHADGAPIGSALYYEIGGGDLVSEPLNPGADARRLGVGVEFRLPTLCDIWDGKMRRPEDYLELVRDYTKGEIDALMKQIVITLIGSAEEVVIAALQRALPGMYDYSQNLKAQLDAEITHAKRSCQQVVDRAAGGNNPWNDWLNASNSYQWQSTLLPAEAGTEPAFKTVLDAERAIRESSGEQSIPWFGTELKGGAGASPIPLVKDLVSAGYAAHITDREYTGAPLTAPTETMRASLGSPSGETTADTIRMSELWPGSNDAVAFAVRVLGEKEVSFCLAEECGGSIKPGLGLKSEYTREYDRLVEAWKALYAARSSAAAPPTIAQLNTLSSNKVRITKQLYQALLGMQPQERDLYTYRLIGDVAIDRVVERALALRQLLKAGANTPQVQAYEAAQDEARALIEQIKDEIDDIAWEVQTQELLASKTGAAIVAAETISRFSAVGDGLGSVAPVTSAPVFDGRTPPASDGDEE
mgnify:CR=1 FL=1